MKQNFLQKSILAVAVTSAMGLSYSAFSATTATADQTQNTAIKNIATATYSVDGQKQPTVESNEVIVNISETLSFELIATIPDTPADPKGANNEYNVGLDVNPNSNVTFTHKLTNTGNLTDTYKLKLEQNGDIADIPSVSDDKDYDLNATTVTYQKKSQDGSNIGSSQTIPTSELTGNGFDVELEPGQYIDITINAKTKDNTTAGNQQNLTLTATGKEVKKTLTNVDNSITKLPTFKIIKSTANTLDLNAADPKLVYTITVTNDDTSKFTEDATNINITDTLPKGLVVDKSVPVKFNVTDVGTTGNTTSSGDLNSRVSIQNSDKTLTIQDVNLGVGDTITITFTAKVGNKAELLEEAKKHNNTIINNAVVTDTVGDENTPISDSTDNNDPTGNQPNTPDDSDDPQKPGGDKPAITSLTDRAVTLEDEATKEMPVKSGTDTVEYTHKIVNNGNADEGGTDRQLTFTIKNPDGDKTVVKKVYYIDPNNQQKVPLTKEQDPSGTPLYKIPTTVTVPPTESLTIGYEVTTDGENSDIGTQDPTVVTLVPTGTNAPTVPPKTDITKIEGLKLVKKQQKANCSTDLSNLDNNWSTDPIVSGVQSGDCIFYQISATNTFTQKDLTNVEIKDLTKQWKDKATYQKGWSSTGSSVQISGSNDTEAVMTTINPLTKSSTANMRFSIKVK